MNRFKFTSCGDELFFSTILHGVASDLNIETRNSLRYIDWHPEREYSGGLPLILNELDYEKIRTSNCLICRKVDIGESEILMNMIDSESKG